MYLATGPIMPLCLARNSRPIFSPQKIFVVGVDQMMMIEADDFRPVV